MGVNLVEDKDTPKLTYGEIFDKYFPLYLSYGMNYEQFWNDRVELAKAYRESHKLEMKRKNEELWLNGVYQMEALKSTIGNMFLKKGSKPHQYPKEPLNQKFSSPRFHQFSGLHFFRILPHKYPGKNFPRLHSL